MWKHYNFFHVFLVLHIHHAYEKTCVIKKLALKRRHTLMKRPFINMSRDFGYYWLRLSIYIVVTICIWTNPAQYACASFIFGCHIHWNVVQLNVRVLPSYLALSHSLKRMINWDSKKKVNICFSMLVKSRKSEYKYYLTVIVFICLIFWLKFYYFWWLGKTAKIIKYYFLYKTIYFYYFNIKYYFPSKIIVYYFKQFIAAKTNKILFCQILGCAK
jgi:hypothetical protein